ncbi:hypothetical protein HOD83_02800 [Candidatus Woesearchaeota archaeon]|jgi:hypothetical protein|nr:hypothetical protein [Candidatus Woesearchaeota archaeon]MBT4114621.1 hypothetical protein [Candidatus Woesearchaeota archaeon]MBT4248495.1 hypothetical protein [Candidatus Woesearchaeota archaeon]
MTDKEVMKAVELVSKIIRSRDKIDLAPHKINIPGLESMPLDGEARVINWPEVKPYISSGLLDIICFSINHKNPDGSETRLFLSDEFVNCTRMEDDYVDVYPQDFEEFTECKACTYHARTCIMRKYIQNKE